MRPVSALLPLTLAMLAAAPRAQELRVSNVLHVSEWRGNTIIMQRNDEAQGGAFVFRYVIGAQLADWRLELPATMILDLDPSVGDSGTSQVLTATWVSERGINIIVQTPCRKFSSGSACVRAHADRVAEMLKTFPIDKEATAKRDAPTIGGMIPSPENGRNTIVGR